MNYQQQSLWDFMRQQSGKLVEQTIQHIGLTFISLFILLFPAAWHIYQQEAKAFRGRF